MKHLRKLLVVMIAFVFAFGTSVTAFAQEEATGAGGDAVITIENAAKGVTYKVVKLFDATITSPPSDAITYTGTIPAALANFFESGDAGITLKRIPDASGKNPGDEGYVDTYYQMTPDDFATMKTWADGIAAGDATYPSYTAVSQGDELKFTGLKYGYYVICSTQGALVTVDSTNKDVTVIDKNPTKPSAEKTVAPEHVSVGQTVTYTATFDTANYLNNPTSGKPEQIVSYIIEDTLPAFLGRVTVTSVTIGGTAVDPAPQFVDKKIEIPWVNETVPTQDHKYTSTYDNGAEIIVTYTATVTADADVGKGNVNTISLKPQVDRGTGKVPYQDRDEWNDSATIYTHAAALQKKAGSEDGDNLAGAEFRFKGLVVSGGPGFYTVVSYDPDPATTELGTIMKCDENGKLVIAGIDADNTTPVVLVGTETKAPEGYNQLAGTFNLTTTVMSEQTATVHGEKTTYYDPDGNIIDEEVTGGTTITRNEITSFTDIPAANIQKIVNKTGTELPETGGIGTTMFYIFGGLLVVGAGIVLVSRNRKVSE